METNERKERLEAAIHHLVSIDMIDGRCIVKDLSKKMDRNETNVRAARRGDERYLTESFVKTFCLVYKNIVSSDWIWNGEGNMLSINEWHDDITDNISSENISEEILMKLTREELVLIVKQMMQLHEEQTEMYRILISQNTEMIRNGQKRLEEIMSMLKKTV